MNTARKLTPYHHYDWGAKVYRVVDSYTDLRPVSRDIAKRIRGIRLSEGVGTFIFASFAGEIRVIKQGITADRYCDEHPDELVGLHAADRRDGKRTLIPTADCVFGDLRAHFVEIGFVGEEELMERVVEGIE